MGQQRPHLGGVLTEYQPHPGIIRIGGTVGSVVFVLFCGHAFSPYLHIGVERYENVQKVHFNLGFHRNGETIAFRGRGGVS